MARHTGFPKGVAVFVGLYLLACGGAAVVQRNGEFVFYLVVMLVLVAMVYGVHRRVGFSSLVLWLLAVWGLLHMAGGTVPIPMSLAQTENETAVLYSLRPWSWLPRYDQVTHAFGFFCATLACGEALLAAARPVRVGVGFACACGLMGMGFGALNEVVEFVAVMTLPNTNVGGYVNTGWDLVSNTVGAGVGALVVLGRGVGAAGIRSGG